MIPPCDSGPPPFPSDHPVRDGPDDGLLYAARAALESLEPRSRSTPSARPSRTTTLGCDVMRPGPWGTSARRLMTLFPPSSRPSRTTSPRCDGRQPQPWRNSTRLRPVRGAIRRASPRGLERTNRPHPRGRRTPRWVRAPEPPGVELLDEGERKKVGGMTLQGLKGCGDSGLLIQATHNHVSSCGFQLRGSPPRKHDSLDFFVLSLIQAEVVSPVRSVPRG